MDAGDRTILDGLHQRRPVRIREPRRLTQPLPLDRARGAMLVELYHSARNYLDRDAAGGGRLGLGRTISEGSQC